MGRYRYLEHVADIYVAAYGSSLEEAFESAALAMFDSMTDISTVEPLSRDVFHVEADDKVALLHDWLLALLLKFEVEAMLFSRFTVKGVRRACGRYVLDAEALGEPLNPKKHPSKVEIKGVTYHNMAVERRRGRVEVRFILDI